MQHLGLPELAPLLAAGLMKGIDRPYQHQADALKAASAAKTSWSPPVRGPERPRRSSCRCSRVLSSESAIGRHQRPTSAATAGSRHLMADSNLNAAMPRARPPGLRAMILYPMNALVDDQLVRLRETLGASGPQSWLDRNRPGHRFWFGRYTSQTPVSGQSAEGWLHVPAGVRNGRTSATHLQILEHRQQRLRATRCSWRDHRAGRALPAVARRQRDEIAVGHAAGAT